jgi:cytochrome c-type biogenesis protein CcmF
MILIFVLTFGRGLLVALFMGVAVWLFAGAFAVLLDRIRLGRVALMTSLNLARTTPRAFYGLAIAHAGMGLTVAGIVGMSAWATEKIALMRPGQVIELSGFEIRFNSVNAVLGPNYEADRGSFDIGRDGRRIATIISERRFFPVRQQQTTSAGIRTNLISNVYVAIGEPDETGAWTVRSYYHPLVPWIWLGTLTMALGGFVSLSDRRLRVGMPRRSSRQPVLAPAE